MCFLRYRRAALLRGGWWKKQRATAYNQNTIQLDMVAWRGDVCRLGQEINKNKGQPLLTRVRACKHICASPPLAVRGSCPLKGFARALSLSLSLSLSPLNVSHTPRNTPAQRMIC